MVSSFFLITDDTAIFYINDAFMHSIDQVFIMSNHNDCCPHMVDTVEQFHDFFRVYRVKVSCWFICNQKKRLINQCPCNSYSLLLTTGQLCGIFPRFILQTNKIENVIYSFFNFPSLCSCNSENKSYIFKNCFFSKKPEILKYNS